MKTVILFPGKYIFSVFLITLVFHFALYGQSRLTISKEGNGYHVTISDRQNNSLYSPEEGLWSIATGWENNWPAEWKHAHPLEMEQTNGWTILSGSLQVGKGEWKLRDAYRGENGMVKCIRRYEWQGDDTLKNITLSVRWRVKGEQLQTFMPGILYYGNPSGEREGPGRMPYYHGKDREMAIFEEHRFPMPFACLESGSGENKFGVALHTVPSPLKDKKLPDHWWSMGVSAFDGYSELVLFSGPVAYNDEKSVVKALQRKPLTYGDTYLTIEPGTVIEKTFYLDVYQIDKRGTAFQQPVYKSLEIFKPFYAGGLPSYNEILQSKYAFAKSRWIEGTGFCGFNMYPGDMPSKIVMGWCGQAASCGYALQVLQNYFKDPDIPVMVQKSLDFLSTSDINDEGFTVRYHVDEKRWTSHNPVSMGQAMYNFALAIKAAKKSGQYNTGKWETFFKKTCDLAATRILSEDWSPRSTGEAFFIAPLAIASELFGNKRYKEAALKGAGHFAQRHLTMEEPYWGGTLDAKGEDKEGAWAAFQAFLSVYEITREEKYLEWAKHACDVCLSYVVDWDIPLPPGRMADHYFKTRGWTVVSPQNQHIDVYGVLYAPEVYKMGLLFKNEDLKKLAIVMYRSCGQLTDPFGSQGEQLQHTNFAQRGDMTDVYNLRGGYSEDWTVFWITAHFLNAAARFEEMGVTL